MSREADFKTRMAADTTLMAILTGGVYAAGDLGPEGLTRDTAPSAFDASGFLKPCAVVRERALVPDGWVHDQESQAASARQIVEVWLYQDRGFDKIDSALARLYALFQGYRLGNAFPCEWAGTPINRQRDEAALRGASMARQDWLVADVIGD